MVRLASFENVRLVKHVPSVSARTNGVAPDDGLNIYARGRHRDQVLADLTGSLSVELDCREDENNVLLSLETAQASSKSSSAPDRLRLLFKRCKQGTVDGDGSAPRGFFQGLSQGKQGEAGPTFWFYDEATASIWTCLMNSWPDYHSIKGILTADTPALVGTSISDRVVDHPDGGMSHHGRCELGERFSVASLDGPTNEQEIPPHLNEYRNSIIALDRATGDIVGILTVPDQSGNSSTQSVHRPCARYIDSGQRAPSQRASILGEDTFAPPPLPCRPAYAGTLAARNDGPESEAATIRLDPRLEASRPELLRDQWCPDAHAAHGPVPPGSEVAAPALRMWHAAKTCFRPNSDDRIRHNTSDERGPEAGCMRDLLTPEQVRAAEDAIWAEALAAEAAPPDTDFAPTHALREQDKSDGPSVAKALEAERRQFSESLLQRFLSTSNEGEPSSVEQRQRTTEELKSLRHAVAAWVAGLWAVSVETLSGKNSPHGLAAATWTWAWSWYPTLWSDSAELRGDGDSHVELARSAHHPAHRQRRRPVPSSTNGFSLASRLSVIHVDGEGGVRSIMLV